jgi:hypothetical protein
MSSKEGEEPFLFNKLVCLISCRCAPSSLSPPTHPTSDVHLPPYPHSPTHPPTHPPMCERSRLGHPTRHFNVGIYRRSKRAVGEVQDSSYFDPANSEGMRSRQQALEAALDDMEAWLGTGEGSGFWV